MCAAGLDVLELGVPFSDPTADGPVIQRSSAGRSRPASACAQVLDMVAALRRETQIPIDRLQLLQPHPGLRRGGLSPRRPRRRRGRRAAGGPAAGGVRPS
ncbi:MAG: tryptophan synthase subunit alpha [Desulfobacterales bacterium]|nr:tryptophan synthase subunit alpha [Desulfobacterales bacterium]